MPKSVLLLIILGSVSLAAQTRQTPPHLPFDDVGICPGEGCVYQEWIANRSIAVRVDRRSTALIAFRLRKGDKVRALTGVVVTTRAGRAQFSQPQDIETADGTIHIVPGQTLFLLTYEGEGYTRAWFNGRLYRGVDTASFYNGVCTFNPGRCTGRIIEKARSVWWIKVRNAAGRVGWTTEAAGFDGKCLDSGCRP